MVSTQQGTGNCLNQQITQTQASQRIDYKIKSGDSLWKIAEKYKISIKQIVSWNKLRTSSVLKIGDKLSIWPRSSSNKLVSGTTA